MMTLEIKSKVSKQGLRAGKTLYYAYPTKREKLSIDQVMEQISSICSLSRIDVESALRAFAEVVCTSFEQGIGVDLGEMGTLMPFVQGKLMNTPEEVTEATSNLRRSSCTRRRISAKHSAASPARSSASPPKTK